MKISQRFTQHIRSSELYSLFNTFGVIFDIVLSVPICIIAVNGAPVSESEKKKKYPTITKVLHTAPGC